MDEIPKRPCIRQAHEQRCQPSMHMSREHTRAKTTVACANIGGHVSMCSRALHPHRHLHTRASTSNAGGLRLLASGFGALPAVRPLGIVSFFCSSRTDQDTMPPMPPCARAEGRSGPEPEAALHRDRPTEIVGPNCKQFEPGDPDKPTTAVGPTPCRPRTQNHDETGDTTPSTTATRPRTGTA